MFDTPYYRRPQNISTDKITPFGGPTQNWNHFGNTRHHKTPHKLHDFGALQCSPFLCLLFFNAHTALSITLLPRMSPLISQWAHNRRPQNISTDKITPFGGPTQNWPHFGNTRHHKNPHTLRDLGALQCSPFLCLLFFNAHTTLSITYLGCHLYYLNGRTSRPFVMEAVHLFHRTSSEMAIVFIHPL